MVKIIVLAAVVMSGCAIRSTRARDATLHYHPTLDELRTAPAVGPMKPLPRAPLATIALKGVTSAYPQPIGLDYSDDGGFRKLTGVEWSADELEAALSDALPLALAGADSAVMHARGSIVSVALYRFGETMYARAALELRVSREGAEVYAARYTASLQGPDREQLLVALANRLVNEIAHDDHLAVALGGGVR